MKNLAKKLIYFTFLNLFLIFVLNLKKISLFYFYYQNLINFYVLHLD